MYGLLEIHPRSQPVSGRAEIKIQAESSRVSTLNPNSSLPLQYLLRLSVDI